CGPWSRPYDQPGDAASRRTGVLAGAGMGDALALSLHPQELVAAHARIVVLAYLADADLGVHDPVPALEQQLCRAGLRRFARRGNAVGFIVPQPARPDDLVSRGDVVAQPRPALRDAAQTL